MKILLKDIKSARWAIIVIIAYFAFLKNYIYTLCPLVLLSGYPCPGCGMTRALFRIMRFDFAGAWSMHPFIYPIGILCLMFCICRYLLNGNYMKYVKGLMICIAVGMVLFYIYRMITMFPEIEPMIYYEGNYINRILDKITRISM
ncbi:MAG: DUF2752 domain-containing protein [Lachnospiraceae bacterium]|nr:DUF2752 domain-containing protein [Lachnospiraceae bacterium]